MSYALNLSICSAPHRVKRSTLQHTIARVGVRRVTSRDVLGIGQGLKISRANAGLGVVSPLTGSESSSGPARSSRLVAYASAASELSPAAKRVERAAQGFRKLGVCSFWSQLVLTVVSSVIVVFAILYRTATQVHTEAGLYLTLFGLLMGFLSTFWAFGYTRLAAKLRQGVETPEQTPKRAEVLKSLTSGITINLVGLGVTLLGLESTCGLLFAKSLAFAASNPYTVSQANPVQALDIFVVQASANTLLSHFLALCFSLWLLRMITSGGEQQANGGDAETETS